MTNQELYTRVRNHLLTQMKKATVAGACAYRANDGSKCAVGILIPDELYDDNFEGIGINDNIISGDDTKYRLIKATGVNPANKHQVMMLTGLQKIHDQFEVDSWRKELDRFAQEFELRAIEDSIDTEFNKLCKEVENVSIVDKSQDSLVRVDR